MKRPPLDSIEIILIITEERLFSKTNIANTTDQLIQGHAHLTTNIARYPYTIHE